MRHYQDLGSASDWLNQISHAARPIRSTTLIWVVTRISALVSQTSFSGETSGSALEGGRVGTWVFFGWVCAAQDSKLAPRSKKNSPKIDTPF